MLKVISVRFMDVNLVKNVITGVNNNYFSVKTNIFLKPHYIPAKYLLVFYYFEFFKAGLFFVFSEEKVVFYKIKNRKNSPRYSVMIMKGFEKHFRIVWRTPRRFAEKSRAFHGDIWRLSLCGKNGIVRQLGDWQLAHTLMLKNISGWNLTLK